MKRGFTLIELLVVMAIIGILSAVVLTSLNTARQKGRDAKRISDVKQIQLALELYFDANSQYPGTIGDTSSSVLVTNGYIASLPTDPSNNAVYTYVPYAAVSNPGVCTGYHLGASLEATSAATDSDVDLTATPAGLQVCTQAPGGTADFSGADSPNKCKATDTGTSCFDVRS